MRDNIDPVPAWDERERLKAVLAYDILDTPKEEEFEDIAKMAARVCNVPIAVINFVDDDRQWFKAEIGLGVRETPRDISICTHAILQPGIFTVPDTTKDDRFRQNPLVTGDPHLRFYAGALLETPEGLPLGTVCVLDYKPRILTEDEAFTLKALARQVMTQLELRRALREKSKSEERLGLALEASGFVGTWEWDVVKDRVFADARFIAAFGGEPSWSTEGAPIADYVKAIHPDDLAHVSASIQEALQNGLPFREEYRLVQKDGSLRWIEARGKCHFDNMGKPIRFPGVAVDITQRKASEETARLAAARFKFMAEAMPQKIWTATPEGNIDYFNRQWMEFTGLTFEQIRDWGWGQFIHPDDLDDTVGTYKKAVEEGKPFEMQQRFRRKDGVYRWHLARGAPMRDSTGKVVMWMGSNTDVTDLYETQKALQEANFQLGDRAAHLDTIVQQRTQTLSETIAELEAFSYSISHDMRAPLRSMIGFCEILKEDHSAALNPEAVSYLNRISSASRRMDQLIQDILVFSRLSRNDVVLNKVDADALIRDVIRSYPNLGTEVIDISIKSALPPVQGNEALLTQCFSNLLENGAKFVAPGTKAQVEVWSESRLGRVKIFFRDNGIGISKHDLNRIFEIFHRVGRDNDGTGIGLAIVRKAAEKMGGTVGVESEPGKGSLFWVELEPA